MAVSCGLGVGGLGVSPMGSCASVIYDETSRVIVITSTVGQTDALTLTESLAFVATSTVIENDSHVMGEVSKTFTITSTVDLSLQKYIVLETGLGITFTSTVAAVDLLSGTESLTLAITSTVGVADGLTYIESFAFTIASTVGLTQAYISTETALSIAIVSTVALTDSSVFNESLSFTGHITTELTDSDLYNPLTIGGGRSSTSSDTSTATTANTPATAETTTTINLSETTLDADKRSYTG